MFDPHAHKDRLDAMQGEYSKEQARLRQNASTAFNILRRGAIVVSMKAEVYASDFKSYSPVYTRNMRSIRKMLPLATNVRVFVEGADEVAPEVEEFQRLAAQRASRDGMTLSGLLNYLESVKPEGYSFHRPINNWRFLRGLPERGSALSCCHPTLDYDLLATVFGRDLLKDSDSGDDDDCVLPVMDSLALYQDDVFYDYRKACAEFAELDYPDELAYRCSWGSWEHTDYQAERGDMRRRMLSAAKEFNAGYDMDDFDEGEGAKVYTRA